MVNECRFDMPRRRLTQIERVERSRRYRLVFASPQSAAAFDKKAFLGLVHDRMTECEYPAPLASFATGIVPEPVREVPLIEEGKKALAAINQKMGLDLMIGISITTTTFS